MAWRVLRQLAEIGQREPALLAAVARCVDALGPFPRPQASVAELFLLERCARLTGRTALAGRCRDQRELDRTPIREVMLRNLKTQTGWVEKKVGCDYLLALIFANEGGPSAAAVRSDRTQACDPFDPPVVSRRSLETTGARKEGDTALAGEVAFHLANLLKVSRVEGTRFNAGRCLMQLLPVLTDTQRNDLAIELVRSLQLDGEGVTRYIPRFLGPLLASLPAQELDELVTDMEQDARRGTEGLQKLLVQAATWLTIALHTPTGDLPAPVRARLHRLMGILLGSLADSRSAVAHEGYAHLALLLDWLRPDPRLADLLRLAAKKVLTLLVHIPGDNGRFFLAAQVLSSLDKALGAVPVAFPRAPRIGFLPGTFDPFTAAHGEMVRRALAHCDEVFVQVDDFSWRKHAQPRFLRAELAWMALSTIPGAYLFPFEPPVNIANFASLERLQKRLGRRVLNLIVGSDVLEGASAYRDPASPIWGIPHLVTTRDEQGSRHWEGKLEHFRNGVQVFQVPSRMKNVSSTYLREALDRRGDLELFCDPLVARNLKERRLYVNYPARKEEVFLSQWVLRLDRAGRGLPPGLEPLASLGAARAVTRWTGKQPRTAVLQSRETGEDLAALTWLEGTAAALPVALADESLAEAAGGRLLGAGALVEAVGAARGDESLVHLDQLLSRIIGQWFSEGLLFSLFGVPETGGERLWEMLRHHGAGWLGGAPSRARGVRWAGIELTNPLVMVHDLEQLLQPPYFRMASVEEALVRSRRAMSSFFAERLPGSGLLHIHEKETKRQLAVWAQERLAQRGGWVVLGLGRQFSRDLVGNSPTIALDLERYLTRQGYEAGVAPAADSPSLELQLTTARELGRNALLLAPFLDSAEPVLQVAEACRKVKVKLREVLVGATSASVHAVLQLSGVPHRAGLVVPHWRGVVRESAVVPFLGGWSIRERRPPGVSLTPSLNDCLPYHDPHPVGLDPDGALDFSRLALEQAGQLFRVLEEAFREAEGRLLSLSDLPALVRHPRCPPFPKGFALPRDCAPSDLINQDLEALARLFPETHQTHREGWRRS
jgi:cytidyltransferase-like protein